MSSYYYMYPTCKISKKKKRKKKMHASQHKAAAGGPLLEISHMPLLSVMTLHYHRLYQISGLSANLSLEDLKELCRQKPP